MTKEARDYFLQTMAAKLAELDAKIDDLQKKTEEKAGEYKGDFDEALQKLFIKKEELTEKLKTIKESSDESWGDIRKGAEAAFSDLKEAFKSAASRFK